MDWVLSIAATCVNLLAGWFYGGQGKTRLIAPILILIGSAIWIVYNITFQQYALFVTLVPNITIAIINIRRIWVAEYRS